MGGLSDITGLSPNAGIYGGNSGLYGGASGLVNGGSAPTTAYVFLLETGDFLLLETGDKLELQ